MIALFSLFLCGGIFFILGIVDFYSEKQQNFWSSGKIPKVNDIKKWNYALGKLFCTYGISVALVGVLCLFSLSDTLKIILISTVPVGGVIVMIIVYIKIIEPKYKVK